MTIANHHESCGVCHRAVCTCIKATDLGNGMHALTDVYSHVNSDYFANSPLESGIMNNDPKQVTGWSDYVIEGPGNLISLADLNRDIVYIKQAPTGEQEYEIAVDQKTNIITIKKPGLLIVVGADNEIQISKD